ncbi:acetate/propionate family kinase [Hydrogenimonas sp.]
MKILVLNAGSSSLKYRFFDEMKAVAEGVVEHIGETRGPKDHAEALETAEKSLAKSGALDSFEELDGAGHRVVHGGERFVEPVVIDDEVVKAIHALIPLAPLHNPANLVGIETMRRKVPKLPQVAVFDTAFHQTMKKEAYLYAIPIEFYEKEGVRRYGFHGTSHFYVAKEAAKILGEDMDKTNLITLHLGNGASACAIENGKSVDTSMGFTPLQGLVMGTRSGDVDPEIPLWMAKKGLDADLILNKKSGLKGLCGENDMRLIEKRALCGDEAARDALNVFIHRIRHYVGAYYALLGRVDAIVFTGGIGENSALVRRLVCRSLENLGIAIDAQKNIDNECNIASSKASVPVFVIATNEELEIARQTKTVLEAHLSSSGVKSFKANNFKGEQYGNQSGS